MAVDVTFARLPSPQARLSSSSMNEELSTSDAQTSSKISRGSVAVGQKIFTWKLELAIVRVNPEKICTSCRMGNEQSILLGMSSRFDQEEIKRMAMRFKKLDIDNSGSLSVEEFMNLPELKQNPLVKRVIEIFDEDQNGEVDFKEFILGISQFSVKGDKMAKLRFAFRIYDIDNDGYISNGELFQVLNVMVGNNLRSSQLQQIVDKTILYADKDEDGKISFEEFCAIVGKTDVPEKMVVDI